MTTLEIVLMMLLVADAIALGTLVLIQQGRGADVGAAFGSGSSNTMFGSGSGSFLGRVTTWLTIGFFVISFGLAYAAKQRADAQDSLGVPTVVVPEAAPEQPAEVLTEEEERVDSDIPDV
jgi:preprotein translocase subunit SecG